MPKSRGLTACPDWAKSVATDIVHMVPNHFGSFVHKILECWVNS